MTSLPMLKVCGIQEMTTIEAVASLSMDYLGFIFAPSRRRISQEQAQEFVKRLRQLGGKQRCVGVFVNASLDEVADITVRTPLDIVQFHGQEAPTWIQHFRNHVSSVKVWKAIGVSSELEHTEETIAARLSGYADCIDALLLDAYDPHIGGGTGRTFRWELIPHYAAWCRQRGLPLWIAGGLNADNVNPLLTNYTEYVQGIDVSSGVETDGMKDINKMIKMIERVKGK
jgi:phosphoribosylanthranilate isomerase